MSRSKYDKISKADLKAYVDNIMYLDTHRQTGEFMAYELHSLDPYTGMFNEIRGYRTFQQDEFVELGSEWVIHIQDNLTPTIAEIFYQMPKRYAHKVSAFKLDIFTNQRDTASGGYRLKVVFYRNASRDYVEAGPLSARQMYVNIVKQAMDPRSEQTGMLQCSSFPDATKDRSHMNWLSERLVEAETMEEHKISDAVAQFWLKAFRQR